MKKLSIISATLLAAGMLYTGQSSVVAQSKLSFGLNIGAGIPMGAFGKKDSTALPVSNATRNNAGKVNDTTKLNGFAKTGFSFNVYGQYMFAGPLGVKVMIGGNMNSYDVATLNSDFATENMNYYHTTVGSPVFTANSYYVGQYLVGPCLKLPAGKINIEAQVLVGLVTSNYPTLTESLDQTNSSGGFTEIESGTAVITFKSASGFGYNINAGIEYKLNTLLGLHLNVGYTGSSLSYAGYTQTASGTVTTTATGFGSTTTPFSNTSTDPATKTMSLGLFQVTVGASVDL